VALVVAVINSKTERANSFRAGIDAARQAELDVKDERITLRDEQLARCEADKADLRQQLARERART
jgi:hypothetical protein